jgi:hypothetical protein
MSAPPKRPLFNKPSWSNPTRIESADDLFHRSNQTYLQIAAEAEERRKKRIAKLQQERKSEDVIGGRRDKRRRFSDDSEDDGDSSGSEKRPDVATGENIDLGRPNVPPNRDTSLPIAVNPKPTSEPLSTRPEDLVNERNLNKAKASVSSRDIIDLEDEESDGDLQVTAPKVSRPAEEDELPSSDDEFSELAKKAREKARRIRPAVDSVLASQNSSHAAQGDLQIQPSKSLREPPPSCPPLDPVVQLLITSQIPNTEPLIVSRKVSQRLKEVRLVWCERQHFTAEFIPKVFLTWKGNRLFDVTTCKSLGIDVGLDGGILLKGRKDIMGDCDGKIHMEATTEEIFAEQQKAKRRVISERADDNEVEEVVPVAQATEAQVRIILKAKGFEDFKLRVKSVRNFNMYTCCFLLMASSLPLSPGS